MHRCFQILEIVYLICEEISRIPKHKHTLAALAGTCHSFEEPALAVLWATLPCITPLVRCLPPDCWTPHYLSEKIVIEKPIALADCSRFFLNARRVRTLEIGGENSDHHAGPCIHMNVFDHLSIFAMGQCLVPNIKTLRWFPHNNPGLISHIHLFLGPKLEAISFEIGLAEILPLSLLVNLKVQYPSLKCLEVKTYHGTTKHVEAISSVIRDWESLCDIRVPSLSNDALAYVATLPGLTHLGLSTTTRQEGFGELSQKDAFPDLRALTLGCKTSSFYTEVLKSISSRPLEVLNVLGDRSPRYELIDFFEVVEEHCDQSSLRTISFFDTMIDKMGRRGTGPGSHFLFDLDDYIISPKVLEPLLYFSGLIEVDLDPVGSFDLDNAAVKDMAMAWPHLRRLSLGKRYPSTARPRVTLFGLLPIAEYCKNIEFLSISIDARSGIRRGIVPETRGVRNGRLVTLGVGTSAIEEPMLVGSFLSSVFPGLVDIVTLEPEIGNGDDKEEPGLTPSQELWGKVQDFISVFAFIRAEQV
ncbi:hypothetical protein BDZ94DRAFT_1189577 [Collybia nuda]|uniref:F-box domain-containing protein n=1 Tax=Collybia nuda TaxID=64659 RepID=A0A9P5YBH2_9AGAR|nr:hypothetical protein BDZ94DRAFT_1189577 [Collybia nuda]